MQRLRAADEAHRGHAESEVVERLRCRRNHVGMVGQAEIIVGAQIQQLALAALGAGVADAYVRRLRRRDQPLALGKAVGIDAGEGFGEVGEEAMHGRFRI